MPLGIALIAAPFIAGFSEDGGATRFFVIAGVLELATALVTRLGRARGGPRRRPYARHRSPVAAATARTTRRLCTKAQRFDRSGTLQVRWRAD